MGVAPSHIVGYYDEPLPLPLPKFRLPSFKKQQQQQQQQPQSLQQFHPFARLPAELRLEIWRLSLTPRIVELAGDPASLASSPLLHNPPPTLFAVSREARHEASRLYTKLSFAPFAALDFWGGSLTTEFHINPALDTLYFGPGTVAAYWRVVLADAFLRANLRRLAWTCSNWPAHHPTDEILRELRALREMRYVCDWGAPAVRDSRRVRFVRDAGRERGAPPSPRSAQRERVLLEEFRAASSAYPEWRVPSVGTCVIERNGVKEEVCHKWWCFAHGDVLAG